MTHRTLVPQRARSIRSGPLVIAGKSEVGILRLTLFAGNKFLPEADDQSAPVLGPAPGVVDRLVFLAKNFRHQRGGLRQVFPDQRGFGPAGAPRHRRHAAVGQSRLVHDARRIALQ